MLVGHSTITTGLDLSPRQCHTGKNEAWLIWEQDDAPVHMTLTQHHRKRWRLWCGVNGNRHHECGSLATNWWEMVLVDMGTSRGLECWKVEVEMACKFATVCQQIHACWHYSDCTGIPQTCHISLFQQSSLQRVHYGRSKCVSIGICHTDQLALLSPIIMSLLKSAGTISIDGGLAFTAITHVL